MDTSFSACNLEPSKCRTLSIDQKIQIIRELSKSPDTAQDKLQSWSRKDILDILCHDIVKERKFTGLSKQRMLDYLFKVVTSGKNSHDLLEDDQPVTQSPPKRQRKADTPVRVVPPPSTDSPNSDIKSNGTAGPGSNTRLCQNVACRYRYNASDPFCKRCSCCICYKYDENKDPSLWLFCNSDPPYQGGYSCDRSCHIECALKHDKAGIGAAKGGKRLDGSYHCPYCGKENDLLRSWKKQLTIAKDARRVDVLCYRIYLSHKLLNSTEKYRHLHEVVDLARKKLEIDVGPITGSPNMGRGIVNRLQSGGEVQKLCARGIELIESIISSASPSPVVEQKIKQTPIPSSFIRFPIVASTCLTIVLKLDDIHTLPLDLAGFNLWHRKADTSDYPVDPTGTIVLPNRSIVITELAPSTSYKFKLVAFNHAKVELDSWEVKETTTCCSKDPKGIEVRKQPSFDLSNPSSEGGESNNSAAVYADLNKSPERESDSDFEGCENPDLNGSGLGSGSGSDQVINVKDISETAEMNGVSASALDEEAVLNIIPVAKTSTGLQKDSPDPRSENESNGLNGNDMANGAVIRLISTRPVMPGQTENGKADNVLLPKPDREPGSSSNKWVSGHNDGCMEGSYEYCVKVIRRLECEGLIESNFRVKFLTWFSLRATPQERKIVNVYVDTLIDDPVSLAGQLSDTFSERIYSKGLPPVPNGFCMQLWH
ncbi:hypothetical protein LUZ61_002445 [Rhynchospora tenuis]|uniref:Fibronectin type-III domain-containing protein n=1 Tax=Rhynchospora tenuis TaxID=198213 RepID=A0AAD6ERX2_9POAL|nr:hypothetical protein LUZ61_002445 [Rhynchospora tenuis]